MKLFPRWLIVASGLAMLALIVGGAWFYSAQQQSLRQEVQRNLQSVGQLKVDRINDWLEERLGDASVLVERPHFIETAARWLRDPQGKDKEQILVQFRSLQEHYHYEDVMLVDVGGQVRLNLNGHSGPLDPDAARTLAIAFHERHPMLDLQADSAGLAPHVDVIAPLFAKSEKASEPVGAVILRSDASRFLYPLIRSWPTPSNSAEALLVRRDGDSVLFLNDLRHQPDTAFKLRIPLSSKDVPAVMAVLGKEGVIEGKDYRGVNVLSVLKAIPNSPWFMVAKVDEAEALADLRFRFILILALVVGLLAFLVTAVGMVWQKTGKTHYKELFLAEAALRRVEEGHRITLMSVGDGIISTAADGRVDLLNPVAEALTGWRQEDASGKPLAEVFRIFNEKTRQPVENPVSKVLSEGLVVGLANHSVLVAQDGTERPIADSGAPIRDEHGEIIGVVLVFRDQSEERAAQRLLMQEKEKAQQYLDIAGVMLLALDTNGHVTMVNRKGCEILGYQEGDIVGKDWFEHFLPDKVRDEVKGAFSGIIAGHLEMDEYVENLVLTSGGEARLIAWHNSVFRDQDGSIIGTLASGEDITERKRAEEILQTTLQRFYTILSSMYAGVLLVTDEGRVEFANQAFCDLFDLYDPPHDLHGLAAPEMIQKIQNVFVQPAEYVPRIQEIVAQQRPVRCEEVAIRGGKTYLRDFIPIIVDGKLYGRLWHHHDITDRKRSENLALQAVRLRAVADLSSGVAHHFNNLLQIVMGSASLSLVDLESGDLSEVKTNMERMLEAATLGAETVKRLQTFANVRADVTEGEGTVFDMAATARNAAEVSQPLWKSDPEKKGIKVDLQLDLQDGCLVKGQENEIVEVLINLMRNAAEAMPQGGDIEVKAYKEADEVVMTVRDTGTGIAEEDLPKVFQPFWSSKGVSIGQGMGLAVTHGLVKRHGGTVSVQSKVGKGSTFTIRLPLAQEPIRKTEAPAMRPADGKLTILVIEDDERIAPLLEEMFVEAGHSVFKALSGQEGLAFFDREHVDLVLCDLGMPGMNGWDVGKAIRSVCKQKGITKPPFILLTGWGGQELEREKITESGTDAVVAKPIDSAALLATVQEIAARL